MQMDYKARLYQLRHNRVADVLKQAEKERKLRHEIAMDELEAKRGLHGLSEHDKTVVENATIEILTLDCVFNTLPKGKRNQMMKEAVKRVMANIAQDLKKVVKAVVDGEPSATRGTYAAHRFGALMTFSYYNELYVTINMADHTFTINQVPQYVTARKMVRFLAEMCGVELKDLQEKTYIFEVIHAIDS